jgi:hypothetical protein
MPKNCIMVALKHGPAIHWVMGPIHCGQSVVITTRIVAKGVMGPIHCGQSVVITARNTLWPKRCVIRALDAIHCGQSVVLSEHASCQKQIARNTLWPKLCVVRVSRNTLWPKHIENTLSAIHCGQRFRHLLHGNNTLLLNISMATTHCCQHSNNTLRPRP